ncbi:MAG TPA: ABC transporter permease subunit, partial [Microbacterium sp.]|nr:ABC transporter permease subunit [Microbacterium sp.]
MVGASATRKLRYGLGSLWGALIVLAAMEIVTRAGVLPAAYIPPPSTVLITLVGLLGDPALWIAVGQTLAGWALGLGIAIVIAVPLGLLLGSSELAYRATRPLVEFLRPVPSVALVPLAFLLFPPGLQGKVFLAAFAAIWPILIHTIYGVRNVLPAQLMTARSFQIRKLDVVGNIVIPAAVPYLATGIRISSTVALILVVTGEIVMGSPGVG